MKNIFLYGAFALVFIGIIFPNDDNNNVCGTEKRCRSFYIGGDWLYWKIQQERIQVGSDVTIKATESIVSITSSIVEPHFKYTNGFRVFAGYLPPIDDWQVEGTFTHIPFSPKVCQSLDPAMIQTHFISLFANNFPVWNLIAGDSIYALNGCWDGNVNYFDVDLSRELLLYDCLQIRPHVGIRGQFIKQKFLIDTEAKRFGEQTVNVAMKTALYGNIKSIGLEGGLWAFWNMLNNIFLNGHVGGSLTYARSTNCGNLAAVPDQGQKQYLNYTYNSHLALPSLDSFIGLSYVHNRFNIEIGW